MEIITYLFKTTHELPKLGVNLELRYLGYSVVKINKDKFGSFHSRIKLNMIQFMPWLFMYVSHQLFISNFLICLLII